ncbi:MAG: methylenetetrahydrofolate reductase [NAD(P)H] [Bacteroidia bacterium]|nr:methylenetetrahydrofolate reductase [NAD(P)H] [Bacteroidia bacterium]MCZ2247606.1 methylenetetrahydrofolate reductase [NAD(P)H] [Bacteroidia bacterium]
MKVIDHINKATSTLFSFEILPPLKGKKIDSIYESIDYLIEFAPHFINVTYHREEYLYKKRDGGYLEKVAIRKRPGTVGICTAIINKYKVDAIPHLICGGFTKEETENALIDLQYLGIDNVLALRGDPIKTEATFVPKENGHAYAVDLVNQIENMNKGIYLNEETQSAHSDFCIGVAGYPEKHFEAPNFSTDLKFLKAKIDAGADYIVTQLFYDNDKFFKFREACKNAGINVPIIPGLKPISSKKQLTALPKIFNIDIPEQLSDALLKAKDDKEAAAIGVEWGINQAKELIKNSVPCLHFYTMGKSEAVRNIVKAVY